MRRLITTHARWRARIVATVLAVAFGWAIVATSGAGLWGPGLNAALAQQTDPQTGSDAYGQLAPPAEEQGGDASFNAYEALATNPEIMIDATQSGLSRFALSLRERLADAPYVLDEIMSAMRAASPTGEPAYFLALVGMTFLATIAAFAVTTYVYGVLLLRNWFVSKQKKDPQGYLEKLPILGLRALLGSVGVVLSALLAVAFLRLAWGPLENDIAQKTVIVLVATYAYARVIGLIWRVVLAPFLSHYRIPHFSDQDARRLFAWLVVTGTLALAVPSFLIWLQLIGVPRTINAIVGPILNIVIVVANIALVARNKRAVSRAILGGKPREQATWPARLAASSWGILVVVYVLAAWAYGTARDIQMLPAGPPLIISAYAVLTTLFAVYGVTAFAIEWVFLPRRVEKPSSTTDGVEILSPAQSAPSRSGMRTFQDLANRVATIFAMIGGAYAVSRIWGIVLTSDSAGFDVADALDVGATLLIAYIAYHAVRIWIDQRIEQEGGLDDGPVQPGEGEGGGAGASRLATLLPLFRNFLLAIISLSVLIFIALELGVNVAPLFAGAGIIGLALGFGAQTLVRDILSGAFFLIDDAFRKGEYIDIGSVKGIVEKISVRSFQLRHHLGYLHTVPFGEIQFLTNYSRDWVIMKLPLRLTYDTDVEHVRKLIKNLGQELAEHPIHGEKFLQPLKSQGVIQMEDSAMIVRVKFMTRPGDQWVIRKVVYAEIRELFAREGVKFAHREVTVRIAGGEGLSEEEQRAAGGAARRATDERRIDEYIDDGPGD